MNFDKFKNITPDSSLRADVLNSVDESDANYVTELYGLEYKQKKNNKWIKILCESVAAVAIVVAVALWAVLGRGIQIDNLPGSTQSDTGLYHVLYDITNHTVIHGKNDLQKFFDDFANGKKCAVEFFVTGGDIASDVNKYIGYTKTFYVDETGKAAVYYNSDGIPYFEDSIFGTFDFAYSHEEISVMRFAYVGQAEKWYMQYDNRYVSFNASTLKNTHENSERVYDTSKTDPVTTENYTVKSGEQSLKDFFEHYYKGLATGVTVDGKDFYFDGLKLYTVDNDTSKELAKLEYQTTNHTLDIVEDTIPDSINIEPLNNVSKVALSNTITVKSLSTVIIELNRDEVINLDLAHNAKDITLYQADSHIKITDKTIVETLVTAVKNNPKEQYKTYLGGDCDYTLEFNDNFSLSVFLTSDGTLSDMIGFNYDGFNVPIAIKANAELMTALQSVVDYIPTSSSISDDEKSKLISLSFEYRFDYLPDFDTPDQLSYEDMINYAFAMDGFPRRLKSERLNYTSDMMLGISFDVADDYYVPMSVEGSADYSSDIKKLVKAEKFIIADKQAVTVEFDVYFSEEETTPYRIQKTTYITSDGVTPSKIISNYHGRIDENGNRLYNRANYNPLYAKRWQYLREAIDKYYKDQGQFEEYLLRNQKFYAEPDANGIFPFQFIGDIKPKPEFAAQYGVTDEDGWMGTYWETLWFKETSDSITCIGSGDTMPTIK